MTTLGRKGHYDFLYKIPYFLVTTWPNEMGSSQNCRKIVIVSSKGSFAIDTQMPIVIFLGESVYSIADMNSDICEHNVIWHPHQLTHINIHYLGSLQWPLSFITIFKQISRHRFPHKLTHHNLQFPLIFQYFWLYIDFIFNIPHLLYVFPHAPSKTLWTTYSFNDWIQG